MIVGRMHTERRGRMVGTDDGTAIDRPGRAPRLLAFHGFTGTTSEIREVIRRYGVVARKTARGDVDHTFLTSLVDREGTLRVQYMGVRFDPDEMLRDLHSLLRESGR